ESAGLRLAGVASGRGAGESASFPEPGSGPAVQPGRVATAGGTGPAKGPRVAAEGPPWFGRARAALRWALFERGVAGGRAGASQRLSAAEPIARVHERIEFSGFG